MPTPRSSVTFAYVIQSQNLNILSPNSRPHFHKLARIKKKVKRDVIVETKGILKKLETKGKMPEGEIIWTGYVIKRILSRNVLPDQDNTIASMKCVLDGICEVLGIDDKQLRCERCEFEVDKLCPRIEITMYYETCE